MSLLAAGMQEITPVELDQMLTELGYKIDKDMLLDYYNTGNAEHYRARSMNYNDIKTGQSFAHVDQVRTNTDNLAKLQKIRMWNFVYVNNRIWDL